jgi:O-antigen ligase
MAGVLVVPGAYVLLTLWLALFGAWHARGWTQRIWQPSLAMGALPIWVGMAVYVLFGMAMGFVHGYKASFFEAYAPMLLAPFIVNAVVVARPPEQMLWFGAAAAGCSAGLVAAYQSLYLDIGRAKGAMNNEIMFGDIAVVMGMFSGIGWVYWARHQASAWPKCLLISGLLFSLLASLLSGTKGGWLSILMLAVLFVWLAFGHLSFLKRAMLAWLVLVTIVVLAYLAPHELVIDRVVNGLQGGYQWFSSGAITDGSVSIRLEKWRQAIGMIADKPWTGWETEGAIAELSHRLIAVGAGDGWSQTENDFLQAGIVHGVPAIISYLALYMGFLLAFARIKNLRIGHFTWVGISTAGMLLIVLMLEFGLSVVVLGRNAFRHTLIVWAMLALAYLIVLWQQRQTSQEPS